MAPKLPDADDFNPKDIPVPSNSSSNRGRQEEDAPEEVDSEESSQDSAEEPQQENQGSDRSKGTVGATIAGAAASQSETVQKAQEAARKAEKIAKTASHLAKAAQAFIAVVTNPVFWISMVIVAVAVAGISAIPIVGKNENADGCYGIGGNSNVGELPMDGDSIDIIAARNIIGNWLMSNTFDGFGGKPFTKEQAAAFVGNWQHEAGLNPAITQSGWAPEDSTNEHILTVGTEGGKAVGLVQWDGSRRVALVNFAKERNSIWSSLTVQLDWIKEELNGAEGAFLRSSDFMEPGRSVEDLTHDVNDYYERSGDSRGANPEVAQKRVDYALEFMETFEPGAGITTGGSCLMGGSYDNSGITQLALSIAYPWPQYEESRVSPGDPYGINNAPPAYKEAYAEAEALGGDDPWGTLYASCDRFVATVIRLTVDPNYPWGATDTQYNYMKSRPNEWRRYTDPAEAQPGDVWGTIVNGHILIYVGEVDGMDSIAHASFTSRVGAVSGADYINSNFIDKLGRRYEGFTYIGPNSGKISDPITDP